MPKALKIYSIPNQTENQPHIDTSSFENCTNNLAPSVRTFHRSYKKQYLQWWLHNQKLREPQETISHRSNLDDEGTSSQPPVMMALLSKKMAQMEKEMQDLASKNAALRQHTPQASQLTKTPSKDEKACNSQTGDRHKGERVPNQNQEGSREKDDNQDVDSQKVPLCKEVKGEEKKLKDLIAKLEQRCDFLSDAV